MVYIGLLLITLSVAVNGQGYVRDYPYIDESPKPYSFSYSAPLEDGVGQSSRSETADGTGRVQGSYSLNNDEGHYRVVDYIADENGFRASIRTNEPGTENKNPADVTIQSEAGIYPYAAPIVRPDLTSALEQPVPVPVEPAVVPEIIPIRRPVYRRPTIYAPRNVYRQPAVRIPLNRYAYNRV